MGCAKGQPSINRLYMKQVKYFLQVAFTCLSWERFRIGPAPHKARALRDLFEEAGNTQQKKRHFLLEKSWLAYCWDDLITKQFLRQTSQLIRFKKSDFKARKRPILTATCMRPETLHRAQAGFAIESATTQRST